MIRRLLAWLGRHRYTSTACLHARHAECRKTCKFCGAWCRCACHYAGPREPGPGLLADGAVEAADVDLDGLSAGRGAA